MFDADQHTIVALATPPGESGIAVIRMSGPRARFILSSIFASNPTTTRPVEPDAWEHRRIYHGMVLDGLREVVDDVVCAIMRSPESYTGEDSVEISCHGSALVIDRILRLAIEQGARAAAPGEFTKRAFLNGKMDLIQAEAVADLIHARSELQRRVAQAQLAGDLSMRINGVADELLGLLGIVEANIDFIEEGIDTLDIDTALETIAREKQRLDELLASSSLARPFREGYNVAIAGPVNAGKSSLFNRFVGESRAIVTEIPGTTRDVLREPVVIEGLLFVMHDTAGLRGTQDRIERIGVGLAESAVSTADIVLFVLDASAALTPDAERRLATLDPAHAVVLLNKSDLGPEVGPEHVACVAAGLRTLRVSARTGDGLDLVRKTLVECVGVDRISWIARERVVLNSRLTVLLEDARRQLDVVDAKLRERAPLEILALDVREALRHLEKATGKRYTENLLDTIFSRFCIGK
jgi:tRNA modification GTPase